MGGLHVEVVIEESRGVQQGSHVMQDGGEGDLTKMQPSAAGLDEDEGASTETKSRAYDTQSGIHGRRKGLGRVWLLLMLAETVSARMCSISERTEQCIRAQK